ncbi:DUF2982 domain-containing protein [Photobacterium aphoticum]|nr:DUF2982 domain-containing protein [Photobacterium aphoticum]
MYAGGLVGVVLAALLGFFFPIISAPAIAILVLMAGMLALLGYKYQQGPELTFTLTFMHLQFHSHQGGWLARWKNIDRIAQASVGNDGWYQPLPWVGIRLKDYGEFVEAICPRVASKILIEQRILLVMAHRNMADPPYQLEDILFDDTPFITPSGQVLKGLQAMLANRMRYNRAFLGYDFFISEDFLDRPAADFAGLARRYLAAA